jgi:hypothetical protein
MKLHALYIVVTLFRRFHCDLEDRRALCRIPSKARVLLSSDDLEDRRTLYRITSKVILKYMYYHHFCSCCTYTQSIPDTRYKYLLEYTLLIKILGTITDTLSNTCICIYMLYIIWRRGLRYSPGCSSTISA